MTPAKVNVLWTFFSYGGNSGMPMCLPQIRRWWAKTYYETQTDERVGVVGEMDLQDTPIPMCRNKAIKAAIDGGFDFLGMIDSDNVVDLYLDKDPSAKPFWKSSFDFAYRRLTQKQLPTVIAAPYCGPNPDPVLGGESMPYVFKWLNNSSDQVGFAGAKLQMYDRDEAARMQGIAPAAALPTGVILFATKIFECLPPPYFDYEYTDKHNSQKASTEDVYCTRNLALAGAKKWGTNVVFANWDSWAGHGKPVMVGKPTVLTTDMVGETFAEAVKNDYKPDQRIQWVNPEAPVRVPDETESTDVINPAVMEANDDWSSPEPEEEPAFGDRVMPLTIGDRRIDANETVVNETDRNALQDFLGVWNPSGQLKRALYFGEPDPAVLGMLKLACHGGEVYCVVPNARREGVWEHAIESLGDWIDTTIKFVRKDAGGWSDDEVDLVVIQHAGAAPENIEAALCLINEAGIVVGTTNGHGSTAELTEWVESAGYSIHKHTESSLWSVFARSDSRLSGLMT